MDPEELSASQPEKPSTLSYRGGLGRVHMESVRSVDLQASIWWWWPGATVVTRAAVGRKAGRRAKESNDELGPTGIFVSASRHI